MSNGYNDYRLEMESYVKYFERNGKGYVGVCYKSDYEVDAMGYEFCDLLMDDIAYNDDNQMLIVQVGTSSRNPDGTYYEDYEKTLYVFRNDWLMTDGKDLFVVDEHHINEWEEISEKEYKSLTK